jgi:hypothetical protein
MGMEIPQSIDLGATQGLIDGVLRDFVSQFRNLSLSWLASA